MNKTKKKCAICNINNPMLKRPKTNDLTCIQCFLENFEEEVHQTIIQNNLFTPGEKIAIGVSGGKDSTVLAYVIDKLNKEKNYKIIIELIAVDEGIKGYRDESLETVKSNADELKLPLSILSYKDLFNYTMDEVVPKCGVQNSCTYCGVFRRQALEKGTEMVDCKKLLTGHNADDMAETVLMNLLRGDYNRMPSSTDVIGEGTIKRLKPFKYIYEKEIVMYAHYRKLKYFCTECTYAVGAYRGNLRSLIKDLELERSSCLIDIIHSGENWKIDTKVKTRSLMKCEKCGRIASNKICKACELVEKLNNAK